MIIPVVDEILISLRRSLFITKVDFPLIHTVRSWHCGWITSSFFVVTRGAVTSTSKVISICRHLDFVISLLFCWFDIPFFDLDRVLADTGSVAIRRCSVLLRVCVDTASVSAR